MTGPQQQIAGGRVGDERPGRRLGWLSGLGLLVVPWVVAGLLATLGTVIGPESWAAETTFPWLLLASFAGGLGWIGYGSIRIRGFRRGALPGAAIALLVLVGTYLLVLLLQP